MRENEVEWCGLTDSQNVSFFRVAYTGVVTCPLCKAVVYCSEDCRQQDLKGGFNPQHSHKLWCTFMKAFVEYNVVLADFPFQYTNRTTSLFFSRSELYSLLQNYGVFTMGLWKYLFNTLGHGPGDGLKEWVGLIYDSCSLEQLEPDELFQNILDEENALLRAYANPSDVVSLALHPRVASAPSTSIRLVSINLSGWMEFYAWMNLPFSSLLALLFHWPLTIYHILNNFLPTKGDQAILQILKRKLLSIHLIGVETEVDLLPVFKELDYLISHAVDEIVITMVGLNISPYVNGKKWLLSRRMSATVWRGTYHQFVEEAELSGAFSPPDLVIGFNVGFVAYPTWKKTLEILKVLNVPAYFTDSCPYSCMWNLEILRSVELWPGVDTSDLHSALAPLAVNPFRSPILIRAEGTLWSRFSNAFIFSAQATPTTEAGLETLPSSVKL
ncbi:Zinc finger MYND domain-containing protein 15 [Echinococcus granulosus]|nr:Zinc finger MYND domain-containing protein 15 [Echinococcus granulosus]